MRFRAGLVVGLAVGYYFGTKAGRERYVQIRRVLDEMPLERVVDKGKALGDLLVERFRDDEPIDSVVDLRSA